MLTERKARLSIPLETNASDTVRKNCSSHSGTVIPCSAFTEKEQPS